MKKFYEKVCKLEELIALILVAGIAVLVFVSALMRTIGHPLNWAQDVALIAFAWLIFLGSDVAMRGSGLIGVDLFVKKFPAGVQKVLDILFKVIIAAFLCVLIYYGYGMTIVEVDKDIFREAVKPAYEKLGWTELREQLYKEAGVEA